MPPKPPGRGLGADAVESPSLDPATLGEQVH